MPSNGPDFIWEWSRISSYRSSKKLQPIGIGESPFLGQSLRPSNGGLIPLRFQQVNLMSELVRLEITTGASLFQPLLCLLVLCFQRRLNGIHWMLGQLVFLCTWERFNPKRTAFFILSLVSQKEKKTKKTGVNPPGNITAHSEGSTTSWAEESCASYEEIWKAAT